MNVNELNEILFREESHLEQLRREYREIYDEETAIIRKTKNMRIAWEVCGPKYEQNKLETLQCLRRINNTKSEFEKSHSFYIQLNVTLDELLDITCLEDEFPSDPGSNKLAKMARSIKSAIWADIRSGKYDDNMIYVHDGNEVHVREHVETMNNSGV